MASALSAEDCNRLVFEAVNEISFSKFILVKNSFSQIQVLKSLAQCNDIGETPLVIAMKGENVDLIDELVMFIYLCDRKIAECHEMSTIAIDQLLHHQIPILQLIEHLIPSYNNSAEWLDIVAQVVFKSTSLSRQDKIIALEWIGASQCNFLHDFERDYLEDNPFAVMFRCWRKAMFLRYFPADGEPLLPKIPYVGVPSVASSAIFGTAEEVMTLEELDLLEEDFERDIVNLDAVVRKRCIDLMRRQCFLVIRRISSQANHGHPHWFYLESLYEFGLGITVHNDGNIVYYSRIEVYTHLFILEQMTGFDPKMLSLKLFYVFFKAVWAVFDCFFYMARQRPGSPGREDLSYTNILAATKFISTIAKCFPNPALMSFPFIDGLYSCFAKIISLLAFVLESMSPQLSSQEKQQLEDYLSNYTRNYFLERTTTALHVALHLAQFTMTEKLGLIKLFLRLGADPNAIDGKGRTPLHILAGIEEVYSGENLPVFQALVNAGAHLDMVADNGDTVLAIVKRNRNLCNGDVLADAYFGSLITTTIFPLSCLCAQVIRQHGIRFDEDRLPYHLQEFVSNHSAEGAIDLHQRDN